MKSSGQSTKAGSSASKTKKNSKDREKRKSQGSTTDVNNHNANEKASGVKESNSRLYAGIDSDSLLTYAEQTMMEHLSEEVTNTLAEDINYKLRYIINDSLMKARISGRNAISARDIEESFENLRLQKVYGAPTRPNWIQFGHQDLYCLDDKPVNLVEIAEETNVYYQFADTILSYKWIPEQQEVSTPLKNYFATMCQALVSNDKELRKMALVNIGENPRIGPITEWFYNFGYILLSKDITYDCLTLRALDLIRVLENAEMCRVNVSEKLLQLLVRLMLQRLLNSTTAEEVLNPICGVLAILCVREPLKEFVILKVTQKINQVFDSCALAIVSIVNRLGIDAVRSVFIPNMILFLDKTTEKGQLSLTRSILESYNIICKGNELTSSIYQTFYNYFGDALSVFNAPFGTDNNVVKNECNFARAKCDLLRTRRKLCVEPKQSPKQTVEDVFILPPENCEVRRKMAEMKRESESRESEITVGKISLSLPMFKRKKVYSKCFDHSLFRYNL